MGFGISNKEHLELIYKFSDGAIIGSHFVKQITSNLSNPEKALEKISEEISNFSQK